MSFLKIISAELCNKLSAFCSSSPFGSSKHILCANSLPGEWISTFSRKSLLYSPLTQLCKLFPVKNTNTNTRIHKCTNANTIVAVRFQLFPLTCLACKIRAYIHKCEVKRSTCDSFRNNHNFVEFQKCYEHLILQPAMPAITSQIKICDQQASK